MLRHCDNIKYIKKGPVFDHCSYPISLTKINNPPTFYQLKQIQNHFGQKIFCYQILPSNTTLPFYVLLPYLPITRVIIVFSIDKCQVNRQLYLAQFKPQAFCLKLFRCLLSRQPNYLSVTIFLFTLVIANTLNQTIYNKTLQRTIK